jgi:glutamate carboxypeptidase
MLVAALSLCGAVAAGPPVPHLVADEGRIAAHVDAHAEDAIAFLARLVDVNSGTMNHAGVRQVGAMLRAELEALGFEARWIDMTSVNRAGHLFAERRGSRRRLLLIGHLDTVFEAESPFQRFERDGSGARGPGVEDMKGGDVVILFALKALASVGALGGTTMTVAFTGDEEDPGKPVAVSRRDLFEAGRRSDVALEFEGLARDGGRDYATIARRGASEWSLTVTGRVGHSSAIFKEAAGSGAIFEAARILDAFRRELSGEAHLTFNPGLVLGGTEVTRDPAHQRGTAFGKTNVISPTTVVTGDIRTISDAQLQGVRDLMRAIVARHLPGTSAEITFADGYPAMPPTAANQSILDLLNEVNRDLGVPSLAALDPDLRGAGDISFVAPDVPGLAGLGMPGSGAHTPSEAADLAALPLQIKRAALLIYRLTR